MNLINEVDKPVVKKTIVVYSGRFQPFHRGHYAAYQKLVSKFGSGNVYIGTSNDTSGDKSPFTFREKKKIATTMFGIPSNRFIQIRNPYAPEEILSKFDGKTTQYIAAVGEKDATRLHGKYFKPYKGKTGYGYDEIGYVYQVPAEQNPISGTEVRKHLGGDNAEKAKKFFLKAYPKIDREIYKMITSKIKALNEAGPLQGAGMAVDFGTNPLSHKEDDEVKEEGFPGGVFTGLVSPAGYIGGAPDPKDVAKLSKKIHKKDDGETDKDYVYKPVNESISKSKIKNIADFVGYATKQLNVLLVGPEDTELIHDLKATTGAKVSFLQRTDANELTWPTEHVIELVTQSKEQDLLVLLEATGVKVIPVVS
jgi:phosphopantetheine adenylyltransferase